MAYIARTYKELILDHQPVGYWRLGESGNARVAVDQMGTKPPNLIINSSFEADTAGWTGSTSSYRINVGSTLSVVSGSAPTPGSGVSCCQVVTTSSLAFEGLDYQTLPVTAGVPVTVSMWIRGNAGGEPLQFFIGDGTVGAVTSVPTITTSWQRIILMFTPTASGTTGFAIRTTAAVVCTFFVDAVMATAGASTGYGPFYEGNGGYDGDYTGSFLANLLVGVGQWPSFESGVSGMSTDPGSGSGQTLTWSTAQAAFGTHSALVTTTATPPAGSMDFYSNTFVPVAPNQPYTFSAYCRAVSTVRSCYVAVEWFDSSHTNLLTINGTASVNSNSSWTRYTVSGTAPANAAYAWLVTQVLAVGASEGHYWDAGQFTSTAFPVPYSDTQGVALSQTGALTSGQDNDTSALFDGMAGGVTTTISTLPVFSMEVWARPTVTTAVDQIIINNPASGWLLGLQGNNWTLWPPSGQLNGPSATLNAWHHVVATYDGVTAQLYVNGALTVSSSIVTNGITGNFPIGNGYQAGLNWIGELDEMAVYGYALTAEQIKTHYRTGLGTVYKSQVNYSEGLWRCYGDNGDEFYCSDSYHLAQQAYQHYRLRTAQGAAK